MAGSPTGPKTNGRSGIGHILLATVGSKKRRRLTLPVALAGLAGGLGLQLAELLKVGAGLRLILELLGKTLSLRSGATASSPSSK